MSVIVTCSWLCSRSIAAFGDDPRRHVRVDTRFERVPEQVAHRLPQQHVVSLDDAELAGDRQLAAPRLDFGADVVGGAFGDDPHVDGRRA